MSTEDDRGDLVARSHDGWVERGWGAARGRLAFLLLNQIQRLIIERSEAALSETDLTWSRWEALLVLYMSRNGSLPLGKLAERLMIKPATVTGTVDRLERDGLVFRQQHPSDRRTILASLTPEGRALAEETTQMLIADAFSIEGLSSDEINELIRLLQKWREQLTIEPETSGRGSPQAGIR